MKKTVKIWAPVVRGTEEIIYGMASDTKQGCLYEMERTWAEDQCIPVKFTAEVNVKDFNNA